MATHRLLFLDATSLSAYRWQAGSLHHEGEFSPDAPGIDTFAEYVARSRNSLFYILADVPEEGFQLEDVPFVRGGDRAALIRRKLSQHFYGTPYALAQSLGRASEGRKDEKLLLAALTRPNHLEPWVAALRDAEGQLAGVFSVPLVAAALPRALATAEPRFLLISATRGGLRQTLFDKGQVVFSRLTTLATGSTEEMAVTCASEAEKMYQYMAGQRLVARGSQLHTLVLAHPAQMAAFRNACFDTGTVRFEFVDLLAVCTRVGLRTPPHDTRAEALFLHLAARQTPREQFAPEVDRHHYRLGQIRFGLRAAGYTVFGACLLFAGRQAIEYQSVSQKNADIVAQTQSDRQRYDGILQGLPKIPMSNDALRALIGRYDTLQSQSGGPEPFYLLLSQALQDSPQVELGRIAWSLGSGKGAAAPQPVPAPARPMPAAAAVPVVAAAAQVETAEIQATLPLGLATDHRAQLAAVEAFVERLRARKLEVQTLKLPFEAESTKMLKSSADAVAVPQAPQFSLRVTRRTS